MEYIASKNESFNCSNPHSLFFYGMDNTWIVKIDSKGNVELNSNLTLNDASKAFWNCVIKMQPHLKKQEIHNWLQSKRALDSRDLYPIELLDELERILGT